MAPRKVAYLTPLYFDEASYLGGGERYALNLALGVVAEAPGRYTIDLISYGPKAERRPLAPGVTLVVLPVARRPENPLDAVSWELPTAIADADLVHLHMIFSRSGELGLLAAKQQGKPVVVSDHGGQSSWLGASVGSVELADRVLCYSDFGASRFRTQTPIVVIKGGVDAGRFTPPRARPRRDRVVCVARLLPHKGIDRLIRALPPELPLSICGRPYHPEYFQHLRQLAEDKAVEFVTDADDDQVRDLYARAWANVLPSVYRDCYGQTYPAPELMGLTLLEANACGTPAIASRVAAMPEFIRPGQTGFVFETEAELTALLRRLASDSDLVETIGVNGRKTVEEEFSLRVCGRKLVCLYEELIEQRKKRGVEAVA